jgi:hypothetical protein
MEETKKKKSLGDWLQSLALAVLLLSVQALVLKWCWNLDATSVLGLKPINLSQAVGLIVICRMLFTRPSI